MLEELKLFVITTGFVNLTIGHIIMLILGCILLYLAIIKKYEPLLLIPIGFGILLANIPAAGLMNAPIYELTDQGYKLKQIGGLLYYLYEGNKLGIFPPIIFMGIGAMTDFGPLIAKPRAFCLGLLRKWNFYNLFGCNIIKIYAPRISINRNYRRC